MIRRLVSCSCVVALLALGACGDGDRSLSDRAATSLQTRVEAVKAAAAERDADAAVRALAALRTSLDSLRRSGDVPAERARSILAAANVVEAELVGITTTTTTTTTTTVLPPTPPSERSDDDRGKGNDHGKGNDRGEDEGLGDD
jgi:hypothetical protein